MDRQAFRNRMQQLKQYREQNPGKTYLDFKKYAEGGEIPPNNKPIIPEEPQPYKGKLYKDRYGRKYTEDQLADQMSDLIDTALILPQYPIPSYKDGGIHIKKKNRGKFNALKKRTGKSTEELTHSKNPLTRKRAIFAQNAKKWKHKGRKKK